MREPYVLRKKKGAITVGIKEKSRAKDEPDVLLDDSTPRLRKQFHCLGCGSVAFEYYGSTRLLVAGEAPEGATPKIVQCKNSRCKLMYHIVS